MKTDDRVRVEKLQYDINKEAAKITALSSGKIDIYEYVTGEEIAPSNQLHSHLIFWEKFWKNKQKQLRIKTESK